MKKKIDWDRHFEAQSKSGLSISEYCSRHGLASGSWYSRKSEIKKSRQAFTSLTIKPTSKTCDLLISIEWVDDGRLNFSGSTNDPKVLQYLIGRYQ